MYQLNRFTLEVSAKPFFPGDGSTVKEKARELFLQWRSVLKHADEPALLWWFGDGAEILEFTGDLDQPVEWAKWMGFAEQKFRIAKAEDPNQEALSGADWLFHPKAGDITIRQMRDFVSAVREAAREVLGKPLAIGLAFDPGNEFTKSTFRYERHPEILISNGGALHCIDATARLKGDSQAYAAYPDGIPEGTPFGEFFGKQTRAYLSHVRFDFLWFSNSFGFGRSPYASGAKGEFFDGERFLLERNHEVRDEVMEFWRLFRRECPDIEVACRGTDFTAGFNLVSQATPYRQLYSEISHLVPPPNTPWPALTKNRGIALAGMLSQIAPWPGRAFPYRFYLSDPWWLNSPWIDRYEQNPSDIYLTCGLSRLAADGRLDCVSDVALLSVDTSWGELPEEFADTLVPHLKQGLAERPDAPGPFIWVYPFGEFDKAVFETKSGCERILCHDANIIQAINRGFPLSTVVTTAALSQIQGSKPSLLAGSVLVSSIPDPDSAWETALLEHVERGGAVLCYGNTGRASARFLKALGLKRADELTGDLRVSALPNPQCAELQSGAYAHTLAQNPILSDGGLGEVADSAEMLATASNPAGEERALATTLQRENGAKFAWTRGIATINGFNRRMEAQPVTEVFPTETLFRQGLEALGWTIRVRQSAPNDGNYSCQWHRNRNGFVFSATANDPSTRLAVRTPWGAPLFPAASNRIEDSHTLIDFSMSSWFHKQARCFIEGQNGLVRVSLDRGSHHPLYRKAWYIEGLENATVRIFPWAGCFGLTQILLNPNKHQTLGEEFDGGWQEEQGLRFLVLRSITGRLSFMWSDDQAVQPIPVRDLRT